MSMSRLTRIVLLAIAVLALLAPVASARSGSLRTLRLRVPVPAVRDVSVAAFEMRIGGEGKHHRKQRLALDLINHRERGVFALARLRPEPRHPGRFLGVVEVFHRGGAATSALPSGLQELSRVPPLARAHAADAWDEFWVRAENEHMVKEVVKDNIVELAEDHELGADEFCDPHSVDTYLLGNELIEAAFEEAGLIRALLPTNMSTRELADAAVYELCAEHEEDLGSDEAVVIRERSSIERMLVYLGRAARGPMPPTTYHVGLVGAWAFEGADEVKLTGTLTWAGAAAAANPVTAIKIVLPPAGSTPRAVTNYICPVQLPDAAITITHTTDDTLMCSGGTLALNQQFSVNLQSVPSPSANMGGQLLAQQGGSYLAPFTFGGP
jgi:hypothetical protein